MCAHGGNRGFGFDPSYAGATAAGGDKPFVVRREYFGAKGAATIIRPSLVSCRHVLEHVQDPVAFLQELRVTLEACGDAVLYLEVPSGEELLSSSGLWDYLYEHVSYFSARSLTAVLRAAGFEVLATRRDFNGQFLCAEARIAPTPSPVYQRDDGHGNSEQAILDAARAMLHRLAHWKRWAGELPSGNKVALWGAGSKGVMFLNLLGIAAPGKIDQVVDQNVDKHGRYVGQNGQEIVAPEALRDGTVDQIVLMNGIYKAEVSSRLQEIGVTVKLSVAWP